MGMKRRRKSVISTNYQNTKPESKRRESAKSLTVETLEVGDIENILYPKTKSQMQQITRMDSCKVAVETTGMPVVEDPRPQSKKQRTISLDSGYDQTETPRTPQETPRSHRETFEDTKIEITRNENASKNGDVMVKVEDGTSDKLEVR